MCIYICHLSHLESHCLAVSFYPNSDLQAQGLSCLGILRQGICSTWDQKSLGEFEGFSSCSWMFVVDIS